MKVAHGRLSLVMAMWLGGAAGACAQGEDLTGTAGRDASSAHDTGLSAGGGSGGSGGADGAVGGSAGEGVGGDGGSFDGSQAGTLQPGEASVGGMAGMGGTSDSAVGDSRLDGMADIGRPETSVTTDASDSAVDRAVNPVDGPARDVAVDRAEVGPGDGAGNVAETSVDSALCAVGSTCVQCAEQTCPAQACSLCQDINRVSCAAGCTAILNCVIQNYPCGSRSDPLCFNNDGPCTATVNAQPGGNAPRDWASALINCGCP